MDSALELWRGFYRIDDEAYNQLLSILVTFGPSEEIAHFTDGSHANLLLTGSNLVDESAFNASILNPSVFNSGLPESGVPNRGLSNEDLTHWHSNTSGASTSDFDSLGPTNGHTLHEGPEDCNFLTSNNELYNTTAEIIQSTAITATQTIQKPSSPPGPEEQNGTACIRCWKLKKKCILMNAGICEPRCKASLPPQGKTPYIDRD
ncbi:MAG: hypothetical protein Q9192_005131 [Flavoplaca navasiana]